MRTHDTDARKYRPTRTRRRPPDADAAASRRQRPADDETRTRLAPAAAAGPGRGTRQPSLDTTNKTGAHAAAWHALEPGATLFAPCITTTLRRAQTWTIHRNNQGCTRRDAAARSPLPIEHTRPFPLACLIVHGIQ